MDKPRAYIFVTEQLYPPDPSEGFLEFDNEDENNDKILMEFRETLDKKDKEEFNKQY